MTGAKHNVDIWSAAKAGDLPSVSELCADDSSLIDARDGGALPMLNSASTKWAGLPFEVHRMAPTERAGDRGPIDGQCGVLVVMEGQVEIVTAQRAGRQALVLARTDAAPPGWAARPVTMEELVLGYLRDPAARVVPEPGLEIVR